MFKSDWILFNKILLNESCSVSYVLVINVYVCLFVCIYLSIFMVYFLLRLLPYIYASGKSSL